MKTYDMMINTQFYQKSFPRVLCFILMKDIRSAVLKIQLYGILINLTSPANLALIPQQHVIHQASKYNRYTLSLFVNF